ncbi:hypothetical protein [Bacillus atrophaeus]|uniref:hypothetical protein n=1 Tax=Bacillus atrophaeus TaxID=1452 RepID=UPI002281EA79|nr:hypothetical protein [Bacillus atrophaeus]MCY8855607.1 hypothetical protein [Bacillus atrophaeus]MEC2307894.1 hypothetical protein [Bacillus atrophaeus]MED1029174.1 hypothetical protein [Bacillus atrophaeus]
MAMYEEYALRDETIKTIKKVKDRSHQEELKLSGTTESNIFSMQLLDKQSLQKCTQTDSS